MKNSDKILVLTSLIVLLWMHVSEAATARVMSDLELDQIHAGGLNLNFKQPLGNFSSSADTVTRGAPTALAGNQDNDIRFDSGKVQVIALPKAPKSPGAPQAPEVAEVPKAPQVPIAPKVPEDLLVMVDTPEQGRMGVVIDGSSLSALRESSGSTNVLNVTDTAQQYLQSLANVNAVNSTVPVQINMVVLVNSMVENLNTSNHLAIDMPPAFQF